MKRRPSKLTVGLLLVVALVFLAAERSAAQSCSGVAAWAPNVSYATGAQVTYSNHLYKCLQGHTSLVGWEPPNTPALWQDLGACSGGATPTPTPPATATPTTAASGTPGATPTRTATATATAGNGGGTMQTSYITSYGYNDNDDGNGHFGTAVIAYPDSLHSIATEGSGTYTDPVTFATDSREIAPHTIIYVPHLRKYFIMEDGCAECTTDWNSGRWHVDLFMGPNSALQPEPALDNCEASITGNFTITIAPGAGYPVDTQKMFQNGQCTVHTY
jgi:hypothetical protein